MAATRRRAVSLELERCMALRRVRVGSCSPPLHAMLRGLGDFGRAAAKGGRRSNEGRFSGVLAWATGASHPFGSSELKVS